MNLPMLILLVGFVYVVLFGGLSLLRKEALSGQFALEATGITALVSGVTSVTSFSVHPVFFLVLLYLITMRARMLVDIGNIFSKRGQFQLADRIYELARGLWPDQNSRLVVDVNHGTSLLARGALDEAISTFSDILEKSVHGHLGVKYQAATHYNLGVAYLRKEMGNQATKQFQAVLDTWPASEYARRAANALEKKRKYNDFL